jgi:hypothetical protein
VESFKYLRSKMASNRCVVEDVTEMAKNADKLPISDGHTLK